jgi:hypothetical protein
MKLEGYFKQYFEFEPYDESFVVDMRNSTKSLQLKLIINKVGEYSTLII